MKILKSAIVLLALLILLAGIAYWWAGKDLKELSGAERAQLKADGLAHDFAPLSEGTVHYRLEGPESAPTILLVHGFSVPSFVWDAHFAPLTEAGYRVLAFDNYGRGFSDRPDGPYDAARTDRLIIDLLAHLNIAGKIHLVGYSMGGAAAGLFTARHPERVRSLTLIAPAGVEAIEPSGAVNLLRTPLAGDWIGRVFGKEIFYNRLAEEEKTREGGEAFTARFAKQMEYRGYTNALISTMRHYPVLDGAPGAFRSVGESSVPVLAIWGEKDEVVPFAHSAALTRLAPQTKLISFPQLDHSLTYSAPEKVTPLILEHIRAHHVALSPGGIGAKPRGPAARMQARECDCHVPAAGAQSPAPPAKDG